MSSVINRVIDVFELLAEHPSGLQVSEIASRTSQPVSGAHRMLTELIRLGYVQQTDLDRTYALTVRLPALGLSYFSRSGVPDVVQPVLDRLAAETCELARLSVIDGARLVWVAVAQGATSGLRFDPAREQGHEAHLACTSSGQAWLMTLPDDQALTMVARQGLLPDFPVGPNAPREIGELIETLRKAREAGYASTTDTFMDGMSAIAMPVRRATDNRVIGCISIAGPSVRMRPARIADIAPMVKRAADSISSIASASQYFNLPARNPLA